MTAGSGPVEPESTELRPVSLSEATRVWGYVGLNSFGGPAGQIAVMHREVVDKRRWLSEARFLHALNYCMVLPGPEAQQLATYVGWLMHGVRGGIAGALFVIPGFVVMMALSIVYAVYGQVGWVSGALFGLQAAVVAIVLQAASGGRPTCGSRSGPPCSGRPWRSPQWRWSWCSASGSPPCASWPSVPSPGSSQPSSASPEQRATRP